MAVEPSKLTPERREALLSLLDDPTLSVRKSLAGEFQRLGKEGRQLLQEIHRGQNRVLAWHAGWFLDELKFSDPVAEFKGFIRSLNYELETGALLLSRTVYPDLDVAACCSLLDEISARCRELMAEPASARDKCRILNRVLFHEYGFHGNVEHYTDPLNSHLEQVLRRRKGLPITLSIVYLLVAQRCGLNLEPVGVPGHFLVGCFSDDSPFFIDPFERGVFRTPEDVFALMRENKLSPKITDLAPTPIREVLCRCCRNLANHYQTAGQGEQARLFAEFVDEFENTYARETQESG